MTDPLQFCEMLKKREEDESFESETKSNGSFWFFFLFYFNLVTFYLLAAFPVYYPLCFL